MRQFSIPLGSCSVYLKDGGEISEIRMEKGAKT